MTGNSYSARAVALGNGSTMRGLSDAHLLVHVSVHAASVHGYAMDLQTLVNITELCRERTVDWAAVDRIAAQWRAERGGETHAELGNGPLILKTIRR